MREVERHFELGAILRVLHRVVERPEFVFCERDWVILALRNGSVFRGKSRVEASFIVLCSRKVRREELDTYNSNDEQL